MKKFTLMTKLLAFILVLNLSCSTDSIELLEEENTTEISTKNSNQLRDGIESGSICTDTNTYWIWVEYDFPIFGQMDENGNNITNQQIRADFENEMSQHFTICYVAHSDNCENIDRWTVNIEEFQEYYNPFLGSGAGSGGSGAIIVRGGSSTHPSAICDYQ